MSTTPEPGETAKSEEAPRPPNPVRRWLRHPLTWAGIAGGALMGMVMTLSYIGGLVNPEGNLHGAPVGFVNADDGTDQIQAGEQIQEKLTATEADMFDWQVFDSQDEVEAELEDNALWGAIVVPESFSADLVQIAASSGDASPAELTVLTNEGSGMFQPSVFENLADAAVAEASSEANGLLVAQLDQLGMEISPDNATAIGQPVAADTRAVVELPDKSGRGIAPFYLAVMVTLTGFLSASIVSVVVELLRGTEKLEIAGHELNLAVGDGGTWPVWLAKTLGVVVAAALGAVLVVWTAHGLLGMHLDAPGKAYGWAVLGSLTMGLISLVFLTWFGIAGEVLGVLFTTIFGVPAALGIYPDQAIPGFFGFLASWHPMRYLADGMRSIALYDGTGAGLGKATTVVLVWLGVALVVGAVSAKLLDRAVPGQPD